MFSVPNSFATYYDAYLLTMDMLQDIGIHHTLPRSPCFSINLNSFFVATLSNTWLWKHLYILRIVLIFTFALINDLLSGNMVLKALLNLLKKHEIYIHWYVESH